MALSILSYPSNQSAVSSEMLFVINEATKAVDPVTYPNYKYILDVYIDGDLKARLRSDPDPVNSFGVFDVSVILRDYVPAYNLKANLINPTETYTPYLTYNVVLGEDYGDTLYPGLVTDSDRTAYKTYSQRPFIDSGNVINERMNSFATNSPFSLKPHTAFKSDSWLIIPYIGDVSGATISCGLYANGVIVGGGTIDFSYTTPGDILQINPSFDYLSSLLSLTQAQKDSVTELIVTDNSGTSMQFNYSCSRYPPVTLAWLNPYGAYESQTFGYVSKKSNLIERKEFVQLPYMIDASGVVSYSADGVLYGGKKGFAATTSQLLALCSHILTDDEYTWLADLFSSPQVFVLNETLDLWQPCSIQTTNYDYNTFKNNRLKPLQFSINLDSYNSQML